jgi:hypothetical protein
MQMATTRRARLVTPAEWSWPCPAWLSFVTSQG